MSVDGLKRTATFIIYGLVAGNPTGLQRKISKEYGCPCTIAPIPHSIAASYEFAKPLSVSELDELLSNPSTLMSRVHDKVKYLLDITDRFSV